ncbi:hypothetical protein LCGC14_0465820 [marine sediment metagenome]|uniref:Uncharacterized protein n=1 Tax=marine sediment metagenome TaxID=412755 RepID=A0A0F9VMK7_9ZZZZ
MKPWFENKADKYRSRKKKVTEIKLVTNPVKESKLKQDLKITTKLLLQLIGFLFGSGLFFAITTLSVTVHWAFGFLYIPFLWTLFFIIVRSENE